LLQRFNESRGESLHVPGVDAPTAFDHYPITGADAAWGAALATESISA
jgi:hypothetical protein